MNIRLPYSKTILYYILPVLFILFLSSCSTAHAPAPIESVANSMEDVKTAVTSSGSTVINNSLEWWQWVIIGMFIPNPLDYLFGLLKGFLSFAVKLFRP
ncbi:unimolecular spanin [Vibrio phage Phriendly]|nr:unimolecular spanin [Vibrio phage Phriendly]